ncbi:uncharacterized protein L969DRAFT_105430 [Mixia osmundae IAM 14324]|uniref:Golgi apparatus membrane protein TVP38 n=1 Tax=Mixia osmundae (strain CBS 9802 / IAM 14324 / JCM 22182 / KY 12970) TaxID=764103 RepID=G7DZL0_MIXOS|nr:uncharacterized protein L969DRAFT_105430 [Mixia osmundae IAM 14324]KEI37183.1 hypothetical protein L969DRAFT_105430 [Mixia osmundae IAM 14324]GAA96020.1 hypothetical protein E5Q_02680 [Mixia osmundae IAM 14324]
MKQPWLLTLLLAACVTRATGQNAMRNRLKEYMPGAIQDRAPPSSSLAALPPAQSATRTNNGSTKNETHEADHEGATHVVLETTTAHIYLPRATPSGVPTSTENRTATKPAKPKRSPANIRNLVNAVKALFSLFLHHPLRITWRVILPFCVSIVYSVTIFCLAWSWSLIRLVTTPLLVPFWLGVFKPSAFAIGLFYRFRPLVVFFASGACVGLLVGLIAGLSNGTVGDYVSNRSDTLEQDARDSLTFGRGVSRTSAQRRRGHNSLLSAPYRSPSGPKTRLPLPLETTTSDEEQSDSDALSPTPISLARMRNPLPPTPAVPGQASDFSQAYDASPSLNGSVRSSRSGSTTSSQPVSILRRSKNDGLSDDTAESTGIAAKPELRRRISEVAFADDVIGGMESS